MTLETNSNLSEMDIMLHTNKSKALLVLVAVFVSTVNTETEAKPIKVSKPNIIIIMPDDSSYGNHSCFGNPVIKTPNIDALKKESLLLTRYHSSARCSPSRAKLMSGRHEFLGGVGYPVYARAIEPGYDHAAASPQNSRVCHWFFWQVALGQ